MSKYISIVLVLLILLSGFLYFFSDIKNQQEINEVEQPKKELIQKIHELSSELQEAKKIGNKQKSKDLEKEIEDNLPEQLRTIVQEVKEKTYDLDFYGKVIDQDGNSVSNANIDYSVASLYRFSTTSSGSVETDRSGLFNIKASGYSISLKMPKHPELSNKFLTGTVGSSLSSGQSILLEPNDFGDGIQSWKGYTKKNPYIIRAWKVKSYEKIFHKRKNLFLAPDGSVYSFLQKNSYGKMALKKGRSSEGYLMFSCVRDESKLAEKNGAWEVTIDPVEGGILETTDVVLNEAPLDGYQPNLSIVMDDKEKYGSSILKNKKYYFKSNKNRVYGSLVITFDPYAKKSDCIIDVNYKINPNGSRNLAIPSQ